MRNNSLVAPSRAGWWPPCPKPTAASVPDKNPGPRDVEGAPTITRPRASAKAFATRMRSPSPQERLSQRQMHFSKKNHREPARPCPKLSFPKHSHSECVRTHPKLRPHSGRCIFQRKIIESLRESHRVCHSRVRGNDGVEAVCF